MISRFYKNNKILVDKTYRIFKSKVNMSYKEMVAWKKNKCSRAASIKIDEVINRVTRLLKKPKTTWTATDLRDSKKVISYISRAVKIKDSTTPAKRKWGCMKGKNFYALRNWAYDRDKEKRKRNPIDDIDYYIDNLVYTVLHGDPEKLSDLINYSIQNDLCEDCGYSFRSCKCEKCKDCEFNRCLCKLGFSKKEYYDILNKNDDYTKLIKITNLVSKEAILLAKNTLSSEKYKIFLNKLKIETQNEKLRFKK